MAVALARSAIAQIEPPCVPTSKTIDCQAGIDCRYNSTEVLFKPETLSINIQNFSFLGNYHGSPGFFAASTYVVDFVDWPSNYRFAILNVNYTGRFNATEGIQLRKLTTKAVLDYRDGDAPANSSDLYTMFNMISETAIGGEGIFDDYFEVDDQNLSVAWSPCFNNSDTVATTISIDVQVHDEQIAPWRWGGFNEGFSLVWGIIWEECEVDQSITGV
ncbi:hypothetical protein F4677DRAFT_458730 [Hypoxylon crocopeplum]|nr:hypothetical protein F4677DRAFT_458730 [Hypoxylon crocopeplum]